MIPKMHEIAIVEDMFRIIKKVAEEENLQRIDKVHFTIGKMMQIVPGIFKFAFDAAKENTIAAKSELELEFLPVKMKCRACNHTFLIEHNVFHCPVCKGTETDLVQGRELLIKSIEGE